MLAEVLQVCCPGLHSTNVLYSKIYLTPMSSIYFYDVSSFLVAPGDLRACPVPDQAAIKADETFDFSLLDGFVELAISRRAFDHIRCDTS